MNNTKTRLVADASKAHPIFNGVEMRIYKTANTKIIHALRHGGIGVLPTDTIYGLVGSALSRKSVERIYKVRKREADKPFIILINSKHDLSRFGVEKNKRLNMFLDKIWLAPHRTCSGAGPGPISVILPVKTKKFSYLHRGTPPADGSLAFRLPRDRWLREFLKKTGPLVAPSANPAGMPPAKNIKEAMTYFGDGLDFYLDKGTKKGKPSVLIEVKRY